VVLENGEALEADYVMIGAAAYDAAEMVKGFDGDLAGQMNKIEWSSSATVTVAFKKEDVKVPLKGFGFIVPRVEGRRINASTYSSIKWSYRAPEDMVTLRVFVGGGHHEELVHELDDAAMTGWCSKSRYHRRHQGDGAILEGLPVEQGMPNTP
jgi:oxygen-dependent protoporphyrinogen oxidase